MKLLSKAWPEAGGDGAVRLSPESADDLYEVYGAVAEGDLVTAATVRKVTKDSGGGGGGGGDTERVKLTLSVRAEGAPEYDGVAGTLRVRGKNATETEYVRLGAYHTLELDARRPVTLEKEEWDALALERLKAACDPTRDADLAAVLITEGQALVLLVGPATTLVRQRVEQSMPRKHGPALAGYDKALGKFYENVLLAVSRHVDWERVKCLVVAGPGFAKDGFNSHMWAEAQRRPELRPLLENRNRVVLAHASSAYKHALKEVLASPQVASHVADTKAVSETRALQAFYDMMASDPDRAFYGPGHVLAAHERGAVQTLLLSDSLFRNKDVVERRKWAGLVEEVRAEGGTAHVFSAAHTSGEELTKLTGCAAILRFPAPDLADMEL